MALVQLQQPGYTKMLGRAGLACRTPGPGTLTGYPFCWVANSKDRG